MVPAPVGVQCVECVRRNRAPASPGRWLRASPWTQVTTLLIAANVVVYVVGLGLGAGGGLLGGSPLAAAYGLAAQPVAAGEWWRVFTAAFLHSGLFHIGFNMIALYVLGQPLERALGRAGFGVLYLTGLVAGSLGVLLVSPGSLTVGASGAIFGLFSAMIMGQRASGINPWRSGIVTWLLLNLLFTFLVPGVSIGGHLGGLAGGFIAGAILFRRDVPPLVSRLTCLAVAGGLFLACLWVAGHPLLVR
jgi:membrane associated rhomboid family serine protease